MDNRSGWKLGVGYKTRPRTGDAGAFAGSGSKLQGVWFGWTAGQLGWDWDSWHHHSVAQGRPLLTTPNHGFGYNPDIYFIGSSRSRHQDKTRNKIGRVRPQLIGSHLAHDAYHLSVPRVNKSKTPIVKGGCNSEPRPVGVGRGA